MISKSEIPFEKIILSQGSVRQIFHMNVRYLEKVFRLDIGVSRKFSLTLFDFRPNSFVCPNATKEPDHTLCNNDENVCLNGVRLKIKFLFN